MLSAQLITAPTGRARAIRNFPPELPPRPAKYRCHTLHVSLKRVTAATLLRTILIAFKNRIRIENFQILMETV